MAISKEHSGVGTRSFDLSLRPPRPLDGLALLRFAQDPPDVLFLDLKLPGVPGVEVARRIRALPGPLSQVPIIAFTAYAMTVDREKALAAGCDEYITKPIINPEEIRDKLERLLTQGRPQSA